MNEQFVRVSRITLAVRQPVVPNVQSVRNVRSIKPASIRDASIHVEAHAAKMHVVKSSITIQYAVAPLALSVIHSLAVIPKKVRQFVDMRSSTQSFVQAIECIEMSHPQCIQIGLGVRNSYWRIRFSFVFSLPPRTIIEHIHFHCPILTLFIWPRTSTNTHSHTHTRIYSLKTHENHETHWMFRTSNCRWTATNAMHTNAVRTKFTMSWYWWYGGVLMLAKLHRPCTKLPSRMHNQFRMSRYSCMYQWTVQRSLSRFMRCLGSL